MRNLASAAPAILALALALSGCGSSGSNGSLIDTGAPGTLAISSSPSGASILVDGVDTGRRTPATLAVEADPGLGTEHLVTLSLSGYNTWGTIATVSSDNSFTVQAMLTPSGGVGGSLVAQSEPAGARVFIDNSDTGRVTPALLNDVPAGQHVVEYDLNGHHRYREPVTISSGSQATSSPVLTQVGNGRVTGRVVDPDGRGLVGAQVGVQGLTVTAQTAAYGIFVLPNVPAGVQTLTASLSSGGQSLLGIRDGVNVVDGRLTSNADIVTALGGNVGSLNGRVMDNRALPVEGAVLFASQAVAPNFIPDAALAPRTTESDGSGNYRFQSLPAGYWVVTAAYPGLATVTQGMNPQVFVPGGGTTRLDFMLPSTSVGRPLQPTQVESVAFTMPVAASRAPAAYQGIRDRILAGRPAFRAAAARSKRVPARSRTAPAGSLIEVDVSWRGPDSADVIGYLIGRSELPDSGFAVIEDLLNPFAGLWLDYDQRLAPRKAFYYRVTAVNTLGINSEPSAIAQARPLDQITLVSPIQTTSSATPAFTWNALPDAFAYGVQVYDGFPERSTAPLWESDWVYAPQTSVTYGGPALQTGRTYYWTVISMNSATTAAANGYSIGAITPFVRQ